MKMMTKMKINKEMKFSLFDNCHFTTLLIILSGNIIHQLGH